jgi:hypothetical protein
MVLTAMFDQPGTSFLTSFAVLNGFRRRYWRSLSSCLTVFNFGQTDLFLTAGGR